MKHINLNNCFDKLPNNNFKQDNYYYLDITTYDPLAVDLNQLKVTYRILQLCLCPYNKKILMMLKCNYVCKKYWFDKLSDNNDKNSKTIYIQTISMTF